MEPNNELIKKRNKSLWRALAGACLFWALALPAAAQTFGVINVWIPANLMPEPSSTAVPITTIPKGEIVEQLDTAFFIWWKVRWLSKEGAKEGWISASNVSRLDGPAPPRTAAAAAAMAVAPPQPAAPSQGGTGAFLSSAFASLARQVVNALVVAPSAPAAVTAAPSAAPSAATSAAPPTAPAVAAPVAAAAPVEAPQAPAAPPASRGRAVIFGISQYKLAGVGTLPGVPYDMVSANVMAQLMGITPDRITTYQDDAVTKDAITATLKQLAREVREGDPVLIYYSGHGTRYEDRSRPSGCIEGLLTARGEVFTSQEMSQLLQPLAAVTDGLFVFFDACFSGALSTTRDTGNSELRAKFALTSRASGDLSNCTAVNDLRTRATGNRYIYAGAARFDEMSLDDGTKGGIATSNFLGCMVDGKSQTVEAIRACAQSGIERRLAGDRQFKAHHMTITGDLNIRPVRSDLTPAFKQQLLATLAEGGGTLVNRPAAARSAFVNNSLLAQGWPEVYNPQQAFTAIASKAGRTPLVVEAPETLRIKSGRLQFKVQGPADGFVYVFQATGDGRSAYMLFPNLSDRDNRIKAGQTLELPRASWPLTAGGPEGDNQLLVVFSPAERDIAQLVGEVDGPFLDLAVSPNGMQALALAVSRSSLANEAQCKVEPVASRPAFCAAEYLSNLKTIREVR
jgi:hypothetical protein